LLISILLLTGCGEDCKLGKNQTDYVDHGSGTQESLAYVWAGNVYTGHEGANGPWGDKEAHLALRGKGVDVRALRLEERARKTPISWKEPQPWA